MSLSLKRCPNLSGSGMVKCVSITACRSGDPQFESRLRKKKSSSTSFIKVQRVEISKKILDVYFLNIYGVQHVMKAGAG